jgi:hypothetical protein
MSHARTTIFSPSPKLAQQNHRAKSNGKMTKASIRGSSKKGAKEPADRPLKCSAEDNGKQKYFYQYPMRILLADGVFLFTAKFLAHKDADVYFAVLHRSIRSITMSESRWILPPCP